MNLAIAILNWNGKKLLQRFLPSIIENSEKVDIYIIDNASTDGSQKYIKKNHSQINLIQLKKNYGFAGGYNRGLEKINAELVCLLNNDVLVKKNWLPPIINHFKNNPKTAIAQPHILDLNNPEYFEYAGAAGGHIDRIGYPYCKGRIFNNLEKDNGQYNQDSKVFWASGACFFVRKKSFKYLGGFDEDFFAHMEEIDLCWRAFNQNLDVYSLFKSKVYHLGGGSLSVSPRKTYLNFRNNLFLLLKNLPEKRFLRITERIAWDGIAIIFFVLKLELKNAFAVLSAHYSFLINIRKMKLKKNISQEKKDYYQVRSIILRYLCSKN